MAWKGVHRGTDQSERVPTIGLGEGPENALLYGVFPHSHWIRGVPRGRQVCGARVMLRWHLRVWKRGCLPTSLGGFQYFNSQYSRICMYRLTISIAPAIFLLFTLLLPCWAPLPCAGHSCVGCSPACGSPPHSCTPLLTFLVLKMPIIITSIPGTRMSLVALQSSLDNLIHLTLTCLFFITYFSTGMWTSRGKGICSSFYRSSSPCPQ